MAILAIRERSSRPPIAQLAWSVHPGQDPDSPHSRQSKSYYKRDPGQAVSEIACAPGPEHHYRSNKEKQDAACSQNLQQHGSTSAST